MGKLHDFHFFPVMFEFYVRSMYFSPTDFFLKSDWKLTFFYKKMIIDVDMGRKYVYKLEKNEINNF